MMERRDSLIQDQTAIIDSARAEIERIVRVCDAGPKEIQVAKERKRIAEIKLSAVTNAGTTSGSIGKRKPTKKEKLISALAQFQNLKRTLIEAGVSPEELDEILEQAKANE